MRIQKTITLKFSESPEDERMLEAICRTSEDELRTPLTRQVKHLLQMALGLRAADIPMRLRVLESRIEALGERNNKVSPRQNLRRVK
jgi:hypothetical protein